MYADPFVSGDGLVAARNIAPPTRGIDVHGSPRSTTRISDSRIVVSSKQTCSARVQSMKEISARRVLLGLTGEPWCYNGNICPLGC